MAEIILSVTYREFDRVITGNYGLYKSSEMKAACRTMREYEELMANPEAAAARVDAGKLGKIPASIVAANAMKHAWEVWSQKSGFRKVNARTDNLCKKLAVEMGVMRNDVEDHNAAFAMHGARRIDPKRRQVPTVAVTKQTVPAYMKTLKREGKELGLILIDIFGTASDLRTNGFEVTYGSEGTSVLENVQAVMDTAKDEHMPVINVTMGMKFPMKVFSDHLPPRWYTLDKPKQGLFDGSGFEDWIDGLRLDVMVIAGWDANQCVVTGIFGTVRADNTYVKGLLDLGLTVVTSRGLLGSNNRALESDKGWPYVGPPPK